MSARKEAQHEFGRMDRLRDQQWRCEHAGDRGEDLRGSLQTVVPDENERDQGAELRPDRGDI